MARRDVPIRGAVNVAINRLVRDNVIVGFQTANLEEEDRANRQ